MKKLRGKPGTESFRLVFGPLPKEEALGFLLSEGLYSLATQLNKALIFAHLNTEKLTFWLVYENDMPGQGSGSDQGPTARLALFVTFDEARKGLTKLGVTVIDMHTPRGYLDGKPSNSSSIYRAEGSFAGIASIDFEVIAHKSGKVLVKIVGSMGVDSSDWGKFVQDIIHKHVSDSPLFPWPKVSTKPFAEIGVAVLVTPRWVLQQDEVFGIGYWGTIEFDAEAVSGTHRTEATVGARIVLRSAVVDTPLGSLNAEFSKGVFGRGFFSYNDGRNARHFGIEGGATASFMITLGRLGFGFEGKITTSTDPALQTGNPAGSSPALNPLSSQAREPTGGPKGHHGTGMVIVKWTF